MNRNKYFTLVILSLIITISLISCQSQNLTSGKLFLQQGNLSNAEVSLKRAETSEPDNPEPPFLLGAYVYAEQKKWKEMNSAFNRSLSINNQFKYEIQHYREKYWTDEYNMGAKSFNRALDSQEGNRSNLLSESVQHFENAVSIDPSKPNTYSSLATAYLLLGNTDQAKKTFDYALEFEPNNFALLFNFGKLLLDEGDTDRANEILQRAKRIRPNDTNLIKLMNEAERSPKGYNGITASNDISELMQIANDYVVDNQYNKAIQVYDKAIAKAPKNQTLYYNESMVYIQSAQNYEGLGEIDSAESSYMNAVVSMKKAVQLDPEDLEAKRKLGELYQELEEWEKAASVFQSILRNQPNNPTILKKLAVTYHKMGRTKEGVELLDKAKNFREVTYRVEGRGTAVADVTYTNESGGTSQQEGVTLPWTYRFTSKPGLFTYISAQNRNVSGQITVKIIVDDQIVKQSRSSGQYVIASANQTLE